jgi:hypothetical protein
MEVVEPGGIWFGTADRRDFIGNNAQYITVLLCIEVKVTVG